MNARPEWIYTEDSYKNSTTGELVMNPGTILPNGTIVVAASARNAHEWILLAMRPGFHAADGYAVYSCSRPGDGSDLLLRFSADDIGTAFANYMSIG